MKERSCASIVNSKVSVAPASIYFLSTKPTTSRYLPPPVNCGWSGIDASSYKAIINCSSVKRGTSFEVPFLFTYT
jgi:hypothetical protein